MVLNFYGYETRTYSSPVKRGDFSCIKFLEYKDIFCNLMKFSSEFYNFIPCTEIQCDFNVVLANTCLIKYVTLSSCVTPA